MVQEKKLTARQQQAIRTKETLFLTAMDLFSKKGYDMVSVDEIVAKAGTSKGAFYAHFKSKDQVIIEQFQMFDEHYLRFYNNMPSNLAFVDKLTLFCLELFSYTAKGIGRDMIKVTYSSQLGKADHSFIASENRSIYKITETIIKEGQLTGEIRSDIPADRLAKIIIRCMRGWVYDWCLPDEDFDLVEEGRDFVHTFIENLLKNHR